jgi:general secretion pathway protein C
LAAYALVSWVLQIQSLQSPASQVPVVSPSLPNKALAQAVGNSNVAVALGAPKLASQDKNTPDTTARQWNLLGVVAGASGQGSALIAVDGQAAKAFLPGQQVAPGWVLHSVERRQARLAPSLQQAPTVTLELPK